jgi:hypothetical protein
LGTGFDDGRADTFRAARYQHYFILELQIHGLQINELKIVAKRGPRSYPAPRVEAVTKTLAAKIQETSVNRVVRTCDE